MKRIKFLDVLPFFYYPSEIEVIVTEEGYGDSIIYQGKTGRIFESINTVGIDNFYLVDISNRKDEYGKPITVIRIEEFDDE